MFYFFSVHCGFNLFSSLFDYWFSVYFIQFYFNLCFLSVRFILVHQHQIYRLIYTTFSWHFHHQKNGSFFLSEVASSRRTRFYTSPPSCEMFHERELKSFKPHHQFGKTLAYTKAPACPDIMGVSYLPSFLYFTFQINQLGID